MSEKHFLLPESTLDSLHCALCQGYLSCGPVRVLSGGSCICGRCSLLNENSANCRIISFEAVLGNILFPCRFKQRGCQEVLLYGNTIVNHELDCRFRSFPCPLSSETGCTWKESSSSFQSHFYKCHPQLVVNEGKLAIDINSNTKGTLMLIKNNIAFLIKYQYDSTICSFDYDIRYCKTEVFNNLNYKISLYNSADQDCMIGIKSKNCLTYSENFQDFQNPFQINFKDYLQILDNPSEIIITYFTFNVTTIKDNVDDKQFLSTLRCEICCNYLIPPLYDLENQIICCNCAKNYPEAQLTNNSEVKTLVCEAEFPCRWRNCKFVGKSEDYKIHDLSCKLRCYDCFFPSCNVTFKLSSAIEHLKSHKAEHVDDSLNYKTSFSQNYNCKHLFKIINNLIVIIQHSVVESDTDKELIHRVALFSSDPHEIKGNIEFEHQHCKLRSKPFIVIGQHKTDISLKELPSCFKSSEELRVVVNV